MLQGFCMSSILRHGLATLGLLLAVTTAQASKVTLELEDVDIKEFVRWGAQATNQTIIIHPRVEGRVTVIAGEPIGKDEAYEVFLATLQVHGFTVIKSDGALKVIPATEAKESELPLYDPKIQVGAENIVVKILKVENIAAQEVVNLLKPIASKFSYIAAYPPTNALIIADRSTKIIQLERIIKEIDLAGEVEVDMVELVYANAEEVARTIEQLLKEGRTNGDSRDFKMTVDARSNSILLTGDSITKEQIHSLISRMDKPVKGTGNTSVIRLQYADATKLVPILETVSGTLQKGGKDQRISEADVKIRAHPKVFWRLPAHFNQRCRNGRILAGKHSHQRQIQSRIGNVFYSGYCQRRWFHRFLPHQGQFMHLRYWQQWLSRCRRCLCRQLIGCDAGERACEIPTVLNIGVGDGSCSQNNKSCTESDVRETPQVDMGRCRHDKPD